MGVVGEEVRRVRLEVLPGDLIVIHCTGWLRGEDAGYLEELENILWRTPTRISLMFSALSIEGFAPAFPMDHIEFFRKHRSRIRRIAVVHLLSSVKFAISTVRLATGTDMLGFESGESALEWLRA